MRADSTPGPDDRDARQLTATENADLCEGCVRCCSYLAIAIDSPRASWEYDQWIWALHHEKVSIYVERPEAWFIHFETRCGKLDAHGRCSIHGRHPVLCREYDPRGCERRYPLSGMRAWFHTAEEFETWLQNERPAHWAKLMAWRKDTVDRPADAAAPASWIPLEALGVPSAPRNGAERKSATGAVPAEPLLPVHEEL
jgi:hypothetical protein